MSSKEEPTLPSKYSTLTTRSGMPIFSNGSGNETKGWKKYLPFYALITAYILITIIGGVFIAVELSQQNPVSETPEVEYPYNFEVTKNDLSNKANSFDLKVTMLSKTFSAASDIKVKVQVEQLNGSAVKEVWVKFPRSHYSFDRSTDDFDSGKSLTFSNPVNRVFPPQKMEIVYQMQGCYNVVVYTVPLEKNNVYDPNACSEINIGSLESTYAYAANRNTEKVANETLNEAKVATKLTYMLIAYAGITGGYEAYRAYISNRGDSKTTSNKQD